jgi:hypothetical protein
MARPHNEVNDALDALLDAVGEWRERMDSFVVTGNDDDDVVVTHDCDGRLVELWVQPGLQQQLTVAELEGRINDALAGNAERAMEGFQQMFSEFVGQFTQAPYAKFAGHATADEMADALTKAVGSR